MKNSNKELKINAIESSDIHFVETYKSMIMLSIEGYKILIAINGGAILAMLTFIGQTINRSEAVYKYKACFYWYIAGLVSCVILIAMAYLTQFMLFKNNIKAHERCMIASLALFAISTGMFCCGSISAVNAFVK